MTDNRQRLLAEISRRIPLLLLVVIGLIFGYLSPKFLEARNLVNILIQSASIGIVAAGLTCVLITAGIDLSVGSIMFVSAVVAAKMSLSGLPFFLVLFVVLTIGLLYGAVNALFVTKLRIMAFVATLATLYIGRGFGLWLTQTRALNLPPELLRLGNGTLLSVPLPIVTFIVAVAVLHFVLKSTPLGRHIYAVGQNREGAHKAGINTTRTIAFVYLVSGLYAAIGGLISIAQLGAVSPTFGNQREFAAVAAAVLGGTSLFGGKGQVFPGTVLGAILIQTVENGLVIINADPYIYPLVLSAIIFTAVLIDGFQHRLVARLARRQKRLA